MFKFLIYKFGQFCVNHLPLKVSYHIAMFMSDLQYWLSPRDRRAVRNNLRIIVKDKADISRLTKEVFRNFGKYLVEFFRMAGNVDEKYIQKNVEIRNVDRIDRVLKKGKGGIVLTAHIGNWELGAVILSRLGYPLTAIALPHKERPVNDLFNAQREIHGVTVIPTNIAIRRCLETLKENKLVALLADRDFGHNGEEMEFLTRKAILPKGAAIFSLKTGAPIIPTFLIRQKDDRFTLMVEEPITPPLCEPGEVAKEIFVPLMRQYTTIIEERIKQFPSQWLMFREFFIR